MYDVRFPPGAARYLKKIKDRELRSRFRNAVSEICENPYAGTPKTGDLRGLYGYDIYYNKTNYELAYRLEFQGDTVIVIILAGTRENFYEDLKRYLGS